DGIRDATVTGVQTCALPISKGRERRRRMYLSKVQVEGQRVHNPYELHRALWTLFPGHEHDARGFLFRFEAERPGSATELLLQSEIGRASCRESGHSTAAAEA